LSGPPLLIRSTALAVGTVERSATAAVQSAWLLHSSSRMHVSDVSTSVPHHACTCWAPQRCPPRLTLARGAAPASASASAQSSAAALAGRRTAGAGCWRRQRQLWRTGCWRLHVLCRARRQEQEEDVVADAWSEEVISASVARSVVTGIQPEPAAAFAAASLRVHRLNDLPDSYLN
jgi:hypothetical protein